jgi:hypothetical protein
VGQDNPADILSCTQRYCDKRVFGIVTVAGGKSTVFQRCEPNFRMKMLLVERSAIPLSDEDIWTLVGCELALTL